MRDQYYIIDHDNPQGQRELDSRSMQEYLINNPVNEGELYHTQMQGIKILYNIQSGNVSLVDIENINSDFTSLYPIQRDQVLGAIRCCAKLKLLELLEQMPDDRVKKLIRESHGPLPPGSKNRQHLSEVELDMTLTRIIKLGYPRGGAFYELIHFIAGESKQKPTQVQMAIYTACEDLKIYSVGSHGLTQIKSINVVFELKELINKHLQEKVQSPQLKNK